MTDATNVPIPEVWPSYPTLTAKRAIKTLNDNPGLQLVAGERNHINTFTKKVCAIGLLAVAVKNLGGARILGIHLNNYKKVAWACGVPESYVLGLEDGFEGHQPSGWREHDNDDYRWACMDGIILRYLVDDSVIVERHIQDLLRKGILVADE